jgi:DNA (cytosine-5)-methyltransferase 1
MFLIAYLKDITDEIIFPTPTHYVDLPSGYDGSRAVALKMIMENPDISYHYHEPPSANEELPGALTAEQATADLPPIHAQDQLKAGLLVRGARRFDKGIVYPKQKQPSEYVRLMREWPGFIAPETIKDHVIRYLPRDYSLFARMNAGDQYPEAIKHAYDMFNEKLKDLSSAGEELRPNSTKWKELKASIVPPYADDKFPNKWRKMEADRPARTLLAHLGKDGYSHIHYDSAQARTISVREAARLQSFPDGFVFCGTMNPAFRQIGNAVPPILAKAVGEMVIKTILSLTEQELVRQPLECVPTE